MAAAPAPSPPRRYSLGLALGALLGNAPALRNGFVLDDAVLLSNNPFVRTLAGLAELLRHELFVASAEPRLVPYYRPLSGFLNWFSFQLFGDSAPLQHAFNMLLHVGVTLLLFKAACAQRVRPTVAFGVALLFAVHPATAEVVAYIGGRQDMLGWLIGLAAVMLSGRVRNASQALRLGFGASLAGGWCHELFIGLFVPLAALLAYGEGRAARLKGAAAVGGGALAIAALLLLRRWLGLLDFEVGAGGPARAAQAAVGVGLRLLKDAFAPTDLAVSVSVPLPSLGLTVGLLFGGLLATVALSRGLARRRRDLLGLTLAGVSIIVFSTALHGGVLLKYGVVSDRYAYALLVGLALAGAAVVEAWLPQADAGDSPLLLLARKWGVLALALAMLPLTWARAASWYDQKSLQMAMSAERPEDPETWLAEGLLAFSAGEIEPAYPRCKAYADARPSSDKAHLCVGSWLLLHGRAPEAVKFLRPYALARPGIANARRPYLYALVASRNYDELEQTLRDWTGLFGDAPELREARAALAAARRGSPARAR